MPAYVFAAPAEQAQTPPSSVPAETAKTEQTGEKDETGSIHLGNLDLVTEEYVVQEGDWLIQILRNKGVLPEKDVLKILKLLKELNSSFRDLNMIRPGEKIMILVKAGSSEKDVTIPAPVAEKNAPESSEMEKKEIGTAGAVETEREIPKGLSGQLKYEPHKMRRGDSIGSLAIDKYGLSRNQLYNEYYPLFRECNPSIQDLDRVLVGQKVRLPLFPPVRVVSPEKAPRIPDLDNASGGGISIHPVNAGTKIPNPTVNPEETSVRPPQPPREVAQVRPAPKRPPHSASSKKPKKAPYSEGPKTKGETASVRVPYKAGDIGQIFTEMGSEWIDSGEHFIPLNAGGQINLKASSYPVIRLNDGVTVILDMTGELPRDMSRFIHSTWNEYRIVQLEKGDDLRSALDKILKACGFTRAVKAGESLFLGKDIRFEVKGDWILSVADEVPNPEPKTLVLNLVSSPQGYVPENVKKYLEKQRVQMLEYPPGVNPLDTVKPRGKVYRVEDRFALIEALLKLTGYPFSTREQILAFTGQKEDFRLVINADFFVKTEKGNTIFDLTGLAPQLIALLKKRDISVLSLVDEKDPLVLTSRILEKLQVKSDKGQHRMEAIHDADPLRMDISMPGIFFRGVGERKVLVTPVDVPEEIVTFLLKKDYGLLLLSGFPPNGPPAVK